LTKKTSTVLWELSTHPLLLIFVGSVVGSLLIPVVSERINRKKVFREAALKKSIEIISGRTINRV
jgi:hypothetical protein